MSHVSQTFWCQGIQTLQTIQMQNISFVWWAGCFHIHFPYRYKYIYTFVNFLANFTLQFSSPFNSVNQGNTHLIQSTKTKHGNTHLTQSPKVKHGSTLLTQSTKARYGSTHLTQSTKAKHGSTHLTQSTKARHGSTHINQSTKAKHGSTHLTQSTKAKHGSTHVLRYGTWKKVVNSVKDCPGIHHIMVSLTYWGTKCWECVPSSCVKLHPTEPLTDLAALPRDCCILFESWWRSWKQKHTPGHVLHIFNLVKTFCKELHKFLHNVRDQKLGGNPFREAL